ncbi:MAG TPA: hypothetical protein PLF47_01580, partial [Dokdonella sp.]|nr:hypothetical protein [Dokdonella sp.]
MVRFPLAWPELPSIVRIHADWFPGALDIVGSCMQRSSAVAIWKQSIDLDRVNAWNRNTLV